MIDFGKSFEKALSRTNELLFTPFDFGFWFALGFSAWLASFLTGGYSGGTKFNNFGNRSPNVFGGPNNIMDSLLKWGLGTWLVILVAFFVLILAMALVFIWLGARGQFMFLDNVLHRRSEVERPWKEFRYSADSFFKLYAPISIAFSALFMGGLIVALINFWPNLIDHRFPGFPILLPWLLGTGVLALASIPLSILMFLTVDVGVPIMYVTGCSALEAFSKIWQLVARCPWDLVFYLLLRFVMTIVFVIISLVAGCLTCCIGLLPYLSSVLTLPLTAFRLYFTLGCLEEWGYNPWPAPPVPPIPSVPPPLP